MESAIREVVNHGAPAEDRRCSSARLPLSASGCWSFIDNYRHDAFPDRCQRPTVLKLGFSLLATLRGIPQIYSGDEIAMPGAEDPDNRHDFPGGFPGDTHNAFTQAGRTPEEQDVYAHVQGLLNLRREHPALRVGVQKHVVVADDYYVFTRETAGWRRFFQRTAKPSGGQWTSIANTAVQGLNSAPAATVQGY
jgi:glycosidase